MSYFLFLYLSQLDRCPLGTEILFYNDKHFDSQTQFSPTTLLAKRAAKFDEDLSANVEFEDGVSGIYKILLMIYHTKIS